MRVLLVEDNPELAALIVKGLNAAGFDVDLTENAVEADEALLATTYAAVILDRGLPDEDGLAVLRRLRQRREPTPVLVLTAKSGVDERVTGLRSGADDYLIKPFAFDELVARLEALLRRPGQLLGQSLQAANVTFDTLARQAFVDGRPQQLSAREVDVLELLMRRKGNVVSRRLLENHVFGHISDVSSNAVEVYVHRLRKQLLKLGADVRISTIRGVGYVMSENKNDAAS